MRLEPVVPPRVFQVGLRHPVELRDCGRVTLAPDEQVTFVTESGGEYDVVRKAWGFYATPSLNGRLTGFGLRAALVRSPQARFYVFLVERGREGELDRYLLAEEHTVVAWLDSDEALGALQRAVEGGEPADAAGLAGPPCVCGHGRLATVFRYDAPPRGETRFAFTAGAYRRLFLRCDVCGHFVARHAMDTRALYAGDYVRSNYGEDGLRAAYERILALGPDRSDNWGRVRRVLEFAAGHFAAGAARERTLLDVGSGLGVFVHRMKDAGWRCTALDPDPRAVRHAVSVVGVTAVHGDFSRDGAPGRFDVVTLNKVLEHLEDPLGALTRAAACLAPGGFLYLEVPDGEAAAALGPDREEFFVDHWHAFSPASVARVAARAGFRLLSLERVVEPSGKVTLRAFLDDPDGNGGRFALSRRTGGSVRPSAERPSARSTRWDGRSTRSAGRRRGGNGSGPCG